MCIFCYLWFATANSLEIPMQYSLIFYTVLFRKHTDIIFWWPAPAKTGLEIENSVNWPTNLYKHLMYLNIVETLIAINVSSFLNMGIWKSIQFIGKQYFHFLDLLSYTLLIKKLGWTNEFLFCFCSAKLRKAHSPNAVSLTPDSVKKFRQWLISRDLITDYMYQDQWFIHTVFLTIIFS